MRFALHSSSGASYAPRAGDNPNPVRRRYSDDAIRRRRALRGVDRALSKRKHDAALSLVKRLQGPPGGGRGGLLRAFGAAAQGYKIPSMETLRQNRYANGGVELADPSYLPEENKDKKSSMNLSRFFCIALGGIVAEHLVFGCAEGLKSDVQKLERMVKSAGFGEREADSHVRWAILYTAVILQRHNGARTRLVDAMATGRSVGFCIDTIENAIDGDSLSSIILH